MRRDLISPLAQVNLHNALGVNWEALVWVDDNAEETRIGVDEPGLEADLQVVEDRGIIEISQVGHVLTFLELGRVDLANLFGLENFFLKKINNKAFLFPYFVFLKGFKF
jgi:hypothetical protein